MYVYTEKNSHGYAVKYPLIVHGYKYKILPFRVHGYTEKKFPSYITWL